MCLDLQLLLTYYYYYVMVVKTHGKDDVDDDKKHPADFTTNVVKLSHDCPIYLVLYNN